MSVVERCGACLARGRRLLPLGTARATHVLCTLIEAVGAGASLPVCWECRALVDKSLLFCDRVRRAQAVLDSTADMQNEDSVSTLATVTITEFDYELLDDDKSINQTTLPADIDIPIITGIKIEAKNEESEDFFENYSSIVDDDVETKLVLKSDSQEFCGTTSAFCKRNCESDRCVPYNSDVNNAVERINKTNKKKLKAKRPATTINGVKITLISEEERLKVQEQDRASEHYVKSLFKCETCVVGFMNEIFLQEHNEKKHKLEIGPHACDICAVRFSRERALWAHRARHYQQYECSECEFTRRAINAVQRHHRDVHRADELFACTQCNQVFGVYRQLVKHRIDKHMEKKKCPHCNKLLVSWYYSRHILKHEQLEQMECAVCRRKYRGRECLKAHTLRAHTVPAGDSAFCVECDQQFKDKYSYQQHLRQSSKHVAFDSRKYVCEECNKRFLTAPELRKHKDLVHLKKELSKCEHCGKKYMTARGMKMHVRSVHEGLEPIKNKRCDICDKAFSTTNTLVAHRRTHTGERPYACTVCPATFANNGALYTHNKLVHLKMKRSPRKKKKAEIFNENV